MDRNIDTVVRDGRQGQRRRQWRTRKVEEIQDNRVGYGNRGDVGGQQMRCGKTEMATRVGRTAIDWANIDRERLPT